MIPVAVMAPLIFAVEVPYLYITSTEDVFGKDIFVTVAFSLIIIIAGPALSYLYFWELRAFAAGSLRAAWVVLVLGFIGTAAGAISFALVIVTFAILHLYLTITVLVTAQLGVLFLVYLTLTGPARILRSRESPLLPLFVNRNYQCEFWPGWTFLCRNLWTLVGIPTLSHQRKISKLVVFAALASLTLDTSVIGWLIAFPVSITNFYSEPFLLIDGKEPLAATGWIPQLAFLLYSLGVLSVSAVVFRLLFALSRRLRRYARRRALLSMDEARLADPRRPMLFLRSFGDDQVSLAQAKVPWLLRFFDPLAISGTLEELLLREFGYLGPVVAIGKPSDGLPPLGVARKYCQGEEWREIVGSLMDEALLIVVGVGRSEGLAWEIARLRDEELLSKTVFILPPASAADHSALGQLFGLLGIGEPPRDLVLGRAALALSFPAPDHGLLLISSRVSETEYELALRVPQLADLAPSQRTSATALPLGQRMKGYSPIFRTERQV